MLRDTTTEIVSHTEDTTIGKRKTDNTGGITKEEVDTEIGVDTKTIIINNREDHINQIQGMLHTLCENKFHLKNWNKFILVKPK